MNTFLAVKKRLANVTTRDNRDKTGRINNASTTKGIGSRQIARYLSQDEETVSKDEVNRLIGIIESSHRHENLLKIGKSRHSENFSTTMKGYYDFTM